MPALRNIDRFKNDVNRLIEEGGLLELALNIAVFGKDEVKKADKAKLATM